MVKVVMAVPDVLVWLPGLVTDRLSTFQVRAMVPDAPPAPVVPPEAPLLLEVTPGP